MRTVVFMDPVDYITGKLSPTHTRTIYKRLQSTDRRFTTLRQEDEGKSINGSQQALRARFGAVSKAAHQRLLDSKQVEQDLVNFKNQKQYKTLFGYVFNQVWMTYEG